MSWPDAFALSVGLVCGTFLLWRIGGYIKDW